MLLDCRGLGELLVFTKDCRIFEPADYRCTARGARSCPNDSYTIDGLVISRGPDTFYIDLCSRRLDITVKDISAWGEITDFMTTSFFLYIGTASDDLIAMLQPLIMLHPTDITENYSHA